VLVWFTKRREGKDSTSLTIFVTGATYPTDSNLLLLNIFFRKVPIDKTSTKQDLKKVGFTEKKSKLSYLKMFNTIKSKGLLNS